jgi:phosphatidylglycerophosphatase A
MADPTPSLRPPRLALAVATVFAIGRCRPAPGTWASIATVALVVILGALVPLPRLAPWFGPAAIAVFLVGWPAASRAARHLGRMDPPQVVVDEVCGQLAALALVPPAAYATHPGRVILVALALFRAFDILKPWPVSSLEALPGGFGVMADDAAAGVLAGCLTAATMC